MQKYFIKNLQFEKNSINLPDFFVHVGVKAVIKQFDTVYIFTGNRIIFLYWLRFSIPDMFQWNDNLSYFIKKIVNCFEIHLIIISLHLNTLSKYPNQGDIFLTLYFHLWQSSSVLVWVLACFDPFSVIIYLKFKKNVLKSCINKILLAIL